jgi:hypothetical protein
VADPRDGSSDRQESVEERAEREREDVATPRWVKVFGIVALVFLAAFVILHLAGRGFRGHGGP